MASAVWTVVLIDSCSDPGFWPTWARVHPLGSIWKLSTLRIPEPFPPSFVPLHAHVPQSFMTLSPVCVCVGVCGWVCVCVWLACQEERGMLAAATVPCLLPQSLCCLVPS